MTYYDQENQFLRQRLQKEIPILTALIQKLYKELDRKFHLNGAKVPVTFGFDTDSLGSYTRQSAHEDEHFHFSLLFIAYGVKNPLSKEDRIDLFKHEYAHYMQYNMQIPEKYKWQAGTHGSAWKYCCSLIGAAPTPYYKAGEALMDHNYDKVLKSRIRVGFMIRQCQSGIRINVCRKRRRKRMKLFNIKLETASHIRNSGMEL